MLPWYVIYMLTIIISSSKLFIWDVISFSNQFRKNTKYHQRCIRNNVPKIFLFRSVIAAFINHILVMEQKVLVVATMVKFS